MSYTHVGRRNVGAYVVGNDSIRRRGKIHALNLTNAHTWLGAEYTALCGEKVTENSDDHQTGKNYIRRADESKPTCKRCLKLLRR